MRRVVFWRPSGWKGLYVICFVSVSFRDALSCEENLELVMNERKNVQRWGSKAGRESWSTRWKTCARATVSVADLTWTGHFVVRRRWLPEPGDEHLVLQLARCLKHSALTVEDVVWSTRRWLQDWNDYRQGKTEETRRQTDRLWGPRSCIFLGYCGLFVRGVNLIIHLHLLPSLRMSGDIPSVPPVSHCRDVACSSASSAINVTWRSSMSWARGSGETTV